MKFAFDTDEVLRDTISKMKATYEKFFIEDYVSEEGESPDYSYVEYSGYLEITGQDNGLVWTFVVEEEVAL